MVPNNQITQVKGAEFLLDWTEIQIHTSQEAVEAVSHYLHECGLEGVAIEDPEVLKRDWDTQYGKIMALEPVDYPSQGAVIKAFLPAEEDAQSIIQKIEAYLASLPSFGLDPGLKKITTKLLKHADWAERWKQSYQLIHATERITIKPVWENYEKQKQHEIVIELDPGLAFGTGNHITTLQCLALLEQYLTPGDRVIDVGCGSGILSIAASKLGAENVLAIDLDPEAVRETEKHSRLNQTTETIQVKNNDGLHQVTQQANIIVANLLAEIIIPLIEHLPRVILPHGFFIAAGILAEKADNVVQALEQVGLQVMETRHEGDWVAILSKKW